MVSSSYLYFFQPDRTGLEFGCFGNRIERRIGQPVGAALPEMKGHPNQTGRDLGSDPGGHLHRSAPGDHADFFSLTDTQRLGIGRGNIGGFRSQQGVETFAAAGLGAGIGSGKAGGRC